MLHGQPGDATDAGRLDIALYADASAGQIDVWRGRRCHRRNDACANAVRRRSGGKRLALPMYLGGVGSGWFRKGRGSPDQRRAGPRSVFWIEHTNIVEKRWGKSNGVWGSGLEP